MLYLHAILEQQVCIDIMRGWQPGIKFQTKTPPNQHRLVPDRINDQEFEQIIVSYFFGSKTALSSGSHIIPPKEVVRSIEIMNRLNVFGSRLPETGLKNA